MAKYWHLGKYVSTHFLTLSEQNRTILTKNASKDLTLLQRSNLTFNRVGGYVNQPLAVPIIAAHSRRVRDGTVLLAFPSADTTCSRQQWLLYHRLIIFYRIIY